MMVDTKEIISRVLPLLEEQQKNEVLTLLRTNGFSINGFDKNITRAPNKMIISGLVQSNKTKKCYSMLFLEEIREKEYDGISVAVGKWLKGDKEDAFILLEKMEEQM